MLLRVCCIVLSALLLLSCSDTAEQMNENFGTPQVRDRILANDDPLAINYLSEVKPIIEQRCVVCHGCYDAPCQLKLSSPEGIDRGTSIDSVYATRLFESNPTRLFIDHKNTQEWRDQHFKSVLNERDQTPTANLQGSVLYQLLVQKQQNPLPDVAVLPDDFDFSLDREQQCPSIEEYEDYAHDNPLAGMPYGLPQISKSEFKTLEKWVKQGAPMAQPEPLSKAVLAEIEKWEQLLNTQDNKSQLVSRYIYEHLFLAHIYFPELEKDKSKVPTFFRLVRSATPSGEEIDELATRRPYTAPGVDNFYYRLRRDTGTILTKTHMPYPFNALKKARWDELFYDASFRVENLPGYENGSDPFTTFADIPIHNRYQFLLDEANFTIMGFIKGPVCRGRIALNVIRSKFWVFFVNPELSKNLTYDKFITEQAPNLELPSNYSTEHFALTTWHQFSKLEKQYLQAQDTFLKTVQNIDPYIGLEGVWTGNENAALTIFRHSDNAEVIKGLQGRPPKTAWLINYPVLERIHYLLVAGYDVYGAVGHELNTRLYMDFLRIESEIDFITLLPVEKRADEINSWYRDASKDLQTYFDESSYFLHKKNTITYQSEQPKQELFAMLKQQYQEGLTKAQLTRLQLNLTNEPLSALNNLPNIAVQQLAKTSFILVEDNNPGEQLFTLVRNNAHKNVSSLFLDSKTRLAEEDNAEIYHGLLSNYPEALFSLKASEQTAFTKQLSEVVDSESYAKLLDKYGVRRTSKNFWSVSDKIHQIYLQNDAVRYGLFDYNRLDNR